MAYGSVVLTVAVIAVALAAGMGWLPGDPMEWTVALLLVEAAGLCLVGSWASLAVALPTVGVSVDDEFRLVAAWCSCRWAQVYSWGSRTDRHRAVLLARLAAERHEEAPHWPAHGRNPGSLRVHG